MDKNDVTTEIKISGIIRVAVIIDVNAATFCPVILGGTKVSAW